MAGGFVSVVIKDLKGVEKQLESLKTTSEKAVAATVKDMKSRAPGWVATEVAGVYGIAKNEVTPKSKSAKNPQKKAGGVGVTGDTVESLALVYTGQALTASHFKMRPGSRPTAAEGRKPRRYTVTAEIYKGQRRSLGSGVFLASPTGGAPIAFKREGKARLPIKAVKSVSLPQMVQNTDVAEAYSEKIASGLKERLEHNMKRFAK